MWPTESPWLMAIVFLALVGLTLGLAMKRQTWTSFAVVGMFLSLAVVAFVVDHFVETERERVVSNVEGVVQAFERGDLEATLSYFSPRAHCERAVATLAVASVTAPNPLSLKDIQVELTNEDSVAISHFRVNGSVVVLGRDVGHQASLWRVTWQKEAGDWRITRLVQLNPVSGERIDQLTKLGTVPCQ